MDADLYLMLRHLLGPEESTEASTGSSTGRVGSRVVPLLRDLASLGLVVLPEHGGGCRVTLTADGVAAARASSPLLTPHPTLVLAGAPASFPPVPLTTREKGMTRTQALERHRELTTFVGACPTDCPAALRRIHAIDADFRLDVTCSLEVRRLARIATTWLSIWCSPADWTRVDLARIRVSLSESLRGLEAAIQGGCADA